MPLVVIRSVSRKYNNKTKIDGVNMQRFFLKRLFQTEKQWLQQSFSVNIRNQSTGAMQSPYLNPSNVPKQPNYLPVVQQRQYSMITPANPTQSGSQNSGTDWEKKIADWEKKFKDWRRKTFFTVVTAGLFGASAAAVVPSSWSQKRQKEFRATLGTDILEIESKHLVPSPRNYVQYIDRAQTIVELDKLFVALEQEKEHRQRASRGLVQHSMLKKVQSTFNFTFPVREPNLILITGVPGAGKSELAEEYADKHVSKMITAMPSALRTVRVFKAENIGDFKTQYRKFAKDLGLPVQDIEDDNTLIKKVNEELALRDYWLLVFDNVDTEERFQQIENYIPRGEGTKGRVLITSRSRNIIPPDKLLGAKIANLNLPGLQFTTEQAVRVFSKILGATYFEQEPHSSEEAIELAGLLCLLPQAIKKAALYIKAKHISLHDYIQLIQTKLQAANIALDKLDVQKHHETVNNIVNQLAIQATENKEPLTKDILDFCSLLDGDTIQRNLIHLRFKTNDKNSEQSVIESIELLKCYGLLEDKGQGTFKLHSSVKATLSLANSKEQQESFIKRQFEQMLIFVKNNFNRDNLSVIQKKKNALFALHIHTLLAYYETNKNLLSVAFPKAIYDLLYFQIALAVHYMTIDRSIMAKDLLVDKKDSIETSKRPSVSSKLLNLNSNINKNLNDLIIFREQEKNSLADMNNYSEEIQEKTKKYLKDNLGKKISEKEQALASIDTEALALYAQALYHFGCVYFDVGEDKQDEYKASLEKAVILRKIIDDKTKNSPDEKKRDGRYNDHFADSKAMSRNGVLKFRYKATSLTSELKNIANEYNAMIATEMSKPANERDARHIQSCKSERFRIYQKLAKQELNELKRTDYALEAAKSMYEEKVKTAFNSGTTVDYQQIYDWISNPKEFQDDSRKARYLNDFANWLCIDSDAKKLKLAEHCYVEAIALIEENENMTVDLPDCYLGLAKLYLRQDELELAEKAILRCRLIQSQLSVHSNHELSKEAVEVLEKIQAGIKTNIYDPKVAPE